MVAISQEGLEMVVLEFKVGLRAWARFPDEQKVAGGFILMPVRKPISLDLQQPTEDEVRTLADDPLCQNPETVKAILERMAS